VKSKNYGFFKQNATIMPIYSVLAEKTFDRRIYKMIGYILITIGGWILYDDYKAAKAKKLLKGGAQNELYQTGNDRSSGHRAGKSSAVYQESDRGGGIGIPLEKPKKGGKVHEISKKSVHKVELDQDRNRAGDDSSGKPDAASNGDQSKALKDKSKSKKGGQDAGNQIDNENDVSDNGDNVGLESNRVHESNGEKIDQGDGSSAGD
jgi:hypothetical protein